MKLLKHIQQKSTFLNITALHLPKNHTVVVPVAVAVVTLVVAVRVTVLPVRVAVCDVAVVVAVRVAVTDVAVALEVAVWVCRNGLMGESLCDYVKRLIVVFIADVIRYICMYTYVYIHILYILYLLYTLYTLYIHNVCSYAYAYNFI